MKRVPDPAAAAMLACSLAAAAVLGICGPARAAAGPPVIVTGAVPDEAARQAVVGRLRELFGTDGVEDRLRVGARAAPVGWRDSLDALLTPALRRVRGGRLEIGERTVAIAGEVASPAERDRLLRTLAREGFGLRDELRVAAGQAAVDAAIGRRTVEFEPAAATLTPAGERLLDELLPLLRRGGGRIEVVGHTDSAGARDANLVLSQARADAVKRWLAAHGIAEGRIAARGVGPDEPVADNASAAGRARNRRIEFRVVDAHEESR